MLWESTNLPLELRQRMSLRNLLIVFVRSCLCVYVRHRQRLRWRGDGANALPVLRGDFFQAIMRVYRGSLVLPGNTLPHQTSNFSQSCVIVDTDLDSEYTSSMKRLQCLIK